MKLPSKVINAIFQSCVSFSSKSRIKNPVGPLSWCPWQQGHPFSRKIGRKSLGFFNKKCFGGQKNEKEANLFFWSKSLHTGPNCPGPNVVFFLLKKKSELWWLKSQITMIWTTSSSYSFILMVYIDFYVKFSKWDHNYLVITARSIDCPENDVALRYY